MPKTAKQKQEDFRNRYEQFIFLILKYQEMFENYIAPKLEDEEIEDFLFPFENEKFEIPKGKETVIVDYDKISKWIQKNGKSYLKRLESGKEVSI